MMFVEAFLYAPWAAVSDEDRWVVHKVVRDALTLDGWENATHATAVCGAPVKLVPRQYRDVRVRGTDLRFCQPCRKSLASEPHTGDER